MLCEQAKGSKYIIFNLLQGKQAWLHGYLTTLTSVFSSLTTIPNFPGY